ncbi:MAG: hypothetical protein ACE5GS_01035 [Kiloniellaceae bacterium]
MVSPYLERPIRTLEQVLEQRARRAGEPAAAGVRSAEVPARSLLRARPARSVPEDVPQRPRAASERRAA